MKDQCEHIIDAHPFLIIQKIKKTKLCMDGIFKLYNSVARKNAKLNELINIDGEFQRSFIEFQSCLEDINCELEDLHADDFLTQQDLRDKAHINMYDNSLSGRG